VFETKTKGINYVAYEINFCGARVDRDRGRCASGTRRYYYLEGNRFGLVGHVADDGLGRLQ
jgi:hypothetical protein